MRRVLCVLACSLLLTACMAQGDETEAGGTSEVDALTRRQKDSILARSGIPLTGAIGRATEAADAAGARAAEQDSLLR